jgi:hypothetical protein
MRIAHNVAIARGDDSQAKHWRDRIDAQVDRTVTARFDQGVSLIGVRVIGGVQPRIESWFELASPVGDLMFEVVSTMEARSRFSLVPPDTIDREMAIPPPLATKLWRARFIYKTVTVMNHRVGRERYSGQWVSRDGSVAPRRIDGPPMTPVAVAW